MFIRLTAVIVRITNPDGPTPFACISLWSLCPLGLKLFSLPFERPWILFRVHGRISNVVRFVVKQLFVVVAVVFVPSAASLPDRRLPSRLRLAPIPSVAVRRVLVFVSFPAGIHLREIA